MSNHEILLTAVKMYDRQLLWVKIPILERLQWQVELQTTFGQLKKL